MMQPLVLFEYSYLYVAYFFTRGYLSSLQALILSKDGGGTAKCFYEVFHVVKLYQILLRRSTLRGRDEMRKRIKSILMKSLTFLVHNDMSKENSIT